MLDLLCLSDLHLGEEYSYLSLGADPHSPDGVAAWERYTRALYPLYREVAYEAGLRHGDPPRVEVNTLVLLGDVFELATARIAPTARSGRYFFAWLFDWLKPKQVIYVPGNHDHVFWMWWKLASGQWWRSGDDPEDRKDELAKLYAELPTRTSDPGSPESARGDPKREDLLSYFFGDLSRRPSAIRLAYPAYAGPHCSPPGFRGRLYETLFTHGHLSDPTFIRPGDSGIVARFMHARSNGGRQPADMSSLESVEATTWRYTHH